MPTDDLVLVDINGPVATLTLNRQDKGNALSRAMLDAIGERFAELESDLDIRVVILAAKGKIFSAGHDLAEMRGLNDVEAREALFARCSDLMAAIRTSRLPVIAKIQGAAVAAGCQLVATCDLAYASETVKFGVNGINLGLFCATPSVALSRAVAPKHALDLLLTGRLILAPRAAEIGLINAAVPADRLDAAVQETAELIAAKLGPAIDMGKSLFYRQIDVDIDAAYMQAGSVMADNLDFEETQGLIDGFLNKH